MCRTTDPTHPQGPTHPLSGSELVTQMRFNLVEGVITRVAADYVEFTVRGEVRTDRFLQAESTIHEKPNACN